MVYRVIRKEDCPTSTWSGGTTTELFIWPSGSSYAARDFALRFSTATVDVERSEFTSLPGYRRLLISLDNEIRLDINGQEGKVTPPGTTIAFDGADNTVCHGRCTDFGVMMNEAWSGLVYTIEACTGNPSTILEGFMGLYLPHEGAEVVLYQDIGEPLRAPEHVQLQRGDLLLLRSPASFKFDSKGEAVFFLLLNGAPFGMRFEMK